MIVVTREVAELAHRVYLDYAGGSVESMQAAIEAALPYLTDAGEPLAAPAPHRTEYDGEYWTERFDVLTNAVAKLADLVVDHRAECERLAAAPAPSPEAAARTDLDYQRGYNAALWRVDDAFKKGQMLGRAEAAEPLAGELVCEAGPTDYEVWRDALLISATAQSGPEAAPGIVEEEARVYLRILPTLGAVRPEVAAAQEAGRAAGLADRALDEGEICPDYKD